jgi:hypothetical protein
VRRAILIRHGRRQESAGALIQATSTHARSSKSGPGSPDRDNGYLVLASHIEMRDEDMA